MSGGHAYYYRVLKDANSVSLFENEVKVVAILMY